MPIRFLSTYRILTIVCLLNLLLIPASLSAAEGSIPESSTTEYASMKKISARQFVVNIEKKGIYNISIFFLAGMDSVSLLIKILWKKMFKKDRNGMTQFITT